MTDTDIPNLRYQTSTKALEPIPKGHHNIIRTFNAYVHYRTPYNYPVVNEWVRVTNEKFNEFCIQDYNTFRRLCMAGIVNTRLNSTIFPSKPYSPVDNHKRPIKRKPDTYIFDMVTPLYHDTNNIISVNTDNKFIIPSHATMINKYQGRKEGLEISRVTPSDEPHPMVHHRNKLLYYDARINKTSNTNHTKKISLLTPE